MATDAFDHYLPLTPQQVDSLWDHALVAVDTNVLLNIYRYSPHTRNRLIDVLVQLDDRLWIPNRCFHEFCENRIGVIVAQAKKYGEARKHLSELVEQLRDDSTAPFLEAPTLQNLVAAATLAEHDLKSGEDRQMKLLSNDPLYHRLHKLLAARCGPALDPQDVTTILAEGPDRYARSVPPGYSDSGKTPDDRKFGDLFIWNEILRQSKRDQRPLILVTNDRKDDWWLRASGRTIGPRPELRKEMASYSSQQFHMYEMDQFLRHWSLRQPGQAVDEATLREIVRAQEQSRARQKRRRRLWHVEHGIGLVELVDQARGIARVQFADATRSVPLSELTEEQPAAARQTNPAPRGAVNYTTACPQCRKIFYRWTVRERQLVCEVCQTHFTPAGDWL